MAQTDVFKRYLDAGANFSNLTQKRAEAIVKDLVKAGEVQTEQAQDAVQDLLDRSRKSTERLLDTVRKEVRAQISHLGLVTRKELERIEKRVDSLRPTGGPTKKAAAKKAPAKKAAAKKAPAKKAAAAKKAVAKKAPAKKAAAKKAVAKKAPAKKSAGR